MRVLVIGGGGREHALVWKLAQSTLVDRIYAAPGNPGLWSLAERVRVGHNSLTALADFAVAAKVDLTVVGPESYLALGLVDEFSRRDLAVFGPTRSAAAIEADKSFAKDFMARHDIPTAAFAVFTALAPALAHLAERGAPIVVKASGLAAGKGAYVCGTAAEAEAVLIDLMDRRVLGEAGDRVVLEEYLTGEEASLLVLTDGEAALPLLLAQDYKRVDDGDRGPNTGGMGAYAPAGVFHREQIDRIMTDIVAPAIAGLAAEGRPYRGILYVGLMATAAGPKVIEFNCRLGDPETQAILPLLETDLAALCLAAARDGLAGTRLDWSPGSAVCVVAASGGYPGEYRTDLPIGGLDEAAQCPGTLVFHAGTALCGRDVVTAGGRVLDIVGVGQDFVTARARAYAAMEKVHFTGMHYRRDIAWRECVRCGSAGRRVGGEPGG